MPDQKQTQIFSENLLYLLEKNGKSQKEVADAIGVSQQTFNTWCRGIALPRMGKVQLLADYFKVTKTSLIDPHIDYKSWNAAEDADLISDYHNLSLANQKTVRDLIAALLGK